MLNAFLAETANFKKGAQGSFETALASSRVNMKNIHRLAIVVMVAAGTLTNDLLVSFEQHDADSSGNSKALALNNPYFFKLDASTTMTKVEVDTAAASATIAELETAAGIAVFEVLAEDLDVTNGFTNVSVTLGAAGAARQGTVLFVAHECKNQPAYDVAI